MAYNPFVKILAIILGVLGAIGGLGWWLGAGGNFFALFVICIVILVVMNVVAGYFEGKAMPGGSKGYKLQGCFWILEKHLKFNPVLKSYEPLAVEPNKNYFEFVGNKFRSGELDENKKPLPAEFSLFSIHGNNISFESEFFKKGHWTFELSKGNKQLELTGETINPYAKSLFIFHKRPY
ncbi:MAG: hypothetical protein ABSA74_03075 [Candidatus Staskawiczbacteria bacterium]|jgi:hypothetical protein